MKKSKEQKTKAIDPEVLSPETSGEIIRPQDRDAVASIEANIRREIQLAAKFDKGAAIVAVKIGIGLRSAKKIIGRGNYENWVKMTFGEMFSVRKAYYYEKLAVAFTRQLPAASVSLLPAMSKDTGNWLARTDEGSEFYKAVDSFVGDMTITELYAANGIRAKKQKGGWKPSRVLLEEYLAMPEHKALKGQPFAMWPEDEKKAFHEWHDAQIDADPEMRNKMNAEAAWWNIQNLVTDHGVKEKDWAFLSKKMMDEIQSILSQVAADIRKAMKKE